MTHDPQPLPVPEGAPVADEAAGEGNVWWRFARPFTLIAPALGMVSGAVTALGATLGAAGRFESSFLLDGTAGPGVAWAAERWGDGAAIGVAIALGAVLAAGLNTASNCINQIYDLDIDRINKPERPLCTGEISMGAAWLFTAVWYAVSLVSAWLINDQCLLIVAIGALMTWMYSAPPFRTKRWGVAANVTIAIPRGVLLKVAGWTCVKSAVGVEPWLIGGVFGLFLLGASTTKDYADMEGDRAHGCVTLPIKYGVRRSATMIAPFFVLPFLLLPLGAWIGLPGADTPILTGDPWLLTGLGVLLMAWGAWTAGLILRDPEALAGTENHPSWTHMYCMMFAAQVGFALAYVIHVS